MTQRGHTGVEGQLVQVIGVLAGIIGLIWGILAFFFQEAGSAVVLPAFVAVGGIITFLVGRSTAKANAGSRG